MTPEVHALLGPSSASRWLNCTPSAMLTADLPDTASEYAAAGTIAHAICELKLRRAYIEPMSTRTYNARLKELQADPAYDPEMLSTADAYLEAIDEVYLNFPSKPYVAAEQRVDISRFVPDCFGTADCILICENVLHIFDYKHGAGVPVDAESNPQMMLYALGAIEQYLPTFDGITTVRMTIVQPRAGGVKFREIPRDQLIDWGVSFVRPRAEMAAKGEGDQRPGDWCRFCKIKNTCRARGQYLALESFGQNLPRLYSNEEIGGILERARGLAAWVKDLEDYALSESLAGRTVTGWKAVAGRSIRQFDDTDAAFRDIIAAGTDEALLFERKPLSLAAVEKLLGKKVFAAAAGSHIVTPPGKPTLVPESDKRPAINAAEAAFGGDDETTT